MFRKTMLKKTMAKTALLAILLIAGIFTLAACNSASKPEDTVKAFYQAVEKNDTQAVIKLVYVPDSEKNNKSQVDAKLGLIVLAGNEDIKAHKGIKNIHTDSVQYSDDKKSATVTITVNFNDGETKQDQSRLILSDNKWLLLLR